MTTSLRKPLATIALALLGLGGLVEKSNGKVDSPNLIFILADDLGYGDLSCFGQRNFVTPHLDQMAAEGLQLTRHYSGSTVCAPSRACLLSGQHTGHVHNRVNGKYQFREDPADETIAACLRRAGYMTAMIGKSGLSCNSADGALPNRKGFDHFFGYTSHRRAHRYFPKWLWKNGKQVAYSGNQGRKGNNYSGDLFLEETLSYLEERSRGDQPFFLHLALQQPHADLAVPEPWRKQFVGKFEETPFGGGGYTAQSHPKATYAAMVTYLDDSVGQVLLKLRQLGLAEKTLVIFSSDNGPMREGGINTDCFDSNGPLRGGKRDLYEGGIRVPTLAWWPGTIQAGRSSDHPSAFWDYAATACELAGTAVPPNSDGISYVPTLLGRPGQPKHEYLYWEFYEQGGKQAVRWGDWKGIRLNVKKDRYGPIELYDLSTDVAEQTNHANRHPEIVAKIEQIMQEAHRDSELVSF